MEESLWVCDTTPMCVECPVGMVRIAATHALPLHEIVGGSQSEGRPDGAEAGGRRGVKACLRRLERATCLEPVMIFHQCHARACRRHLQHDGVHPDACNKLTHHIRLKTKFDDGCS